MNQRVVQEVETLAIENYRVVLGNEYDYELHKNLKRVLVEMGGVFKESHWGIAGSQEIDEYEVVIKGETINVVSETYIGLSISGSKEILKEIESAMEKYPRV